MDAHIKYRNMFIQVLLMIVTLGIYSIYWFYQTAEELKGITKDATAQPALWTILLFIPFANLYSYYKYGELYEKASVEHFNRWLMFVLWIFICPAVWIIVQMDLNKRAQPVVPSTVA